MASRAKMLLIFACGACCWCAVATCAYLAVTESTVVVYDGWSRRWEVVRGPLREDGMTFQVPWLLVLLPLVLVALLISQRWVRLLRGTSLAFPVAKLATTATPSSSSEYSNAQALQRKPLMEGGEDGE